MKAGEPGEVLQMGAKADEDRLHSTERKPSQRPRTAIFLDRVIGLEERNEIVHQLTAEVVVAIRIRGVLRTPREDRNKRLGRP